MHFYMPTKVYSRARLRPEVQSGMGNAREKALIVTGKSSAKNGALMDVLGALHEHGTAVVVFDETEENPSIEVVMRVRSLVCGRTSISSSELAVDLRWMRRRRLR